MKSRLIIAYIGNLIDIVSTLYFTSIGFEELNPFVNWLLHWPILFIIIKITFMTLSVILLWFIKEDKLAIIASWVECVFYGGIGIYYIWFFIQIFICEI